MSLPPLETSFKKINEIVGDDVFSTIKPHL